MKRNNIIIIMGLILLCLPFHISYGQGARYTGTYTKSSIIRHSNKSNFIIEGLEISGDLIPIELKNCENVVIKNCKFGPTLKMRGVSLINCKNVTVVDCTFENVQSALRADRSQGIKFEYNDVKNIKGKMHGSNNMGNMVQFVEVSGAGNSISYNVCENLPGQSSTEDVISLYASKGTSQSPIRVKGNWIRGGGPSTSGGGILLGDMGGSYQIAEDNILVNPGQYGVAIAGGDNMTLRNNKVYGKRQAFTNVAVYAYNWYERISKSHTITVEHNRANFTHKDGYLHNWWFPSVMGTIKGKDTNISDPNLSASILPDKIIGRARSAASPPAVDSNKLEPDDKEVRIYLDSYGRICVNNRSPLESSATVVVMDQSGKTVLEQKITSFHTVLPKIPAGNYNVLLSYNLQIRSSDTTTATAQNSIYLKTFEIR